MEWPLSKSQWSASSSHGAVHIPLHWAAGSQWCALICSQLQGLSLFAVSSSANTSTLTALLDSYTPSLQLVSAHHSQHTHCSNDKWQRLISCHANARQCEPITTALTSVRRAVGKQCSQSTTTEDCEVKHCHHCSKFAWTLRRCASFWCERCQW